MINRCLTLAAALFAAACIDPHLETVTVTLELNGVPENVNTLSVTVRDLENDRTTSATVAAPKTSLRLGVPAERPLEFLAIARTDRPGPPGIGAMPAFIGIAERTIALGREEQRVAMTVYRAGVLTILPRVESDVEGLEGLQLHPQNSGLSVASFPFFEEGADEPEIASVYRLILRTGRWNPRLIEDPEERRVEHELEPATGVYVGPEVESLYQLVIREQRPPLPPGAATALVLTAAGAEDGEVHTMEGVRTEISLDLEARSSTGEVVSVAAVAVSVEIDAEPLSVISGPTAFDVGSLPASINGIPFSGLGRAVIRARAQLADGRLLSADLPINILPIGTVPGPLHELALAVADRPRLEEGTRLEIDLLDERGLFASRARAALDLSASDPWAFFPTGPTGQVTPQDRGHALRELSRPSGPRGTPVIIRATVTSTSPELVLTSSIALPLLEISSP